MPALHIRNVPARVLATLRRKARENGRSLNAEVVEALKEYDGRHNDRAALLRQLEAFRREELPPRLPDAPTAEEMIRSGRSDRDRRIVGDL